MNNFFGAVIGSIEWTFATGWKIWSGLFSSIPYGDPYIAVVMAMIVLYVTVKTIYPENRYN